jgi:hypothetical protein
MDSRVRGNDGLIRSVAERPRCTKRLGEVLRGAVEGKTEIIRHGRTVPLAERRAIGARTDHRFEGAGERCGIGALGQAQIVHTHWWSPVFLF